MNENFRSNIARKAKCGAKRKKKNRVKQNGRQHGVLCAAECQTPVDVCV